MSNKQTYRAGDHWVYCQRCASVERSSKVRKEWTGLIVCQECWEPRHEQDFVRARPENTSAKGLVNPEPTDTYIVLCRRNAAVGEAVAGCAAVGSYDVTTPIPSGTFNPNTLQR